MLAPVAVGFQHPLLRAGTVAADEGITDDIMGPWPTVLVCVILVLLFLLVRSIRVVLPSERIVIRHGRTERMRGPGLIFVRPFAHQTRTVPARFVQRHVVAHDVLTHRGERMSLSTEVTALVDPATDRHEIHRDLDVATRRVFRSLAARESWSHDQPTEADRRWFRNELASALAQRGHTLVDMVPAWPHTRLNPAVLLRPRTGRVFSEHQHGTVRRHRHVPTHDRLPPSHPLRHSAHPVGFGRSATGHPTVDDDAIVDGAVVRNRDPLRGVG